MVLCFRSNERHHVECEPGPSLSLNSSINYRAHFFKPQKLNEPHFCNSMQNGDSQANYEKLKGVFKKLDADVWDFREDWRADEREAAKAEDERIKKAREEMDALTFGLDGEEPAPPSFDLQLSRMSSRMMVDATGKPVQGETDRHGKVHPPIGPALDPMVVSAMFETEKASKAARRRLAEQRAEDEREVNKMAEIADARRRASSRLQASRHPTTPPPAKQPRVVRVQIVDGLPIVEGADKHPTFLEINSLFASVLNGGTTESTPPRLPKSDAGSSGRGSRKTRSTRSSRGSSGRYLEAKPRSLPSPVSFPALA